MRNLWAAGAASVLCFTLGLPVEAQEASATPTPAPTPSIVMTRDVPYESDNPLLVPGELDVYAPSNVGPWPVVVMFHGAPSTASERVNLATHARRIADLGFVVFNADWGRAYGGSADPPLYDGILAGQAQGACALEFARARANEYGGDPATMILFGHSGGANNAAQVVFARPAPSAGCLAGTALGDIDALVTWEGDWLLSITHPVLMDRDAMLAADPRLMDALTPWTHLAGHEDQKVVMLVSEDPSASLLSEFPGVIVDREVGDPWAADSWLAVRDPSGDLRRQLEANQTFDDDTLEFREVQELLYSVLEAQGNPVTLDVMPDSSHAYLRGEGWEVFLAAFPKATQD